MHQVRFATHAGTWYTKNTEELSQQITNWLENVEINVGPVRAIIAPHAGFCYSGQCAAYSYKQIDPSKIKRIFILGPSHHVPMYALGLTRAKKLQTPFYDLIVDLETNLNLRQYSGFEWLAPLDDVREHSIEMHLPYIAKVMEKYKEDFKVVPIIVGSLHSEFLHNYKRVFGKYLVNPENLFIISSDFCHWGAKFHFTQYDEKYENISKYIEALDKKAMEIIATLKAQDFEEYLVKTRNTICGKMPILLLLEIVEYLIKKNKLTNPTFKFLSYMRSNKSPGKQGFSVSYAAGALIVNDTNS